MRELTNLHGRDIWARNTSPNKNVKVYIGAPASSSAAGQGYVDASTLSNIATNMRKSFPSFGGVMLWDASQAYGTAAAVANLSARTDRSGCLNSKWSVRRIHQESSHCGWANRFHFSRLYGPCIRVRDKLCCGIEGLIQQVCLLFVLRRVHTRFTLTQLHMAGKPLKPITPRELLEFDFLSGEIFCVINAEQQSKRRMER